MTTGAPGTSRTRARLRRLGIAALICAMGSCSPRKEAPPEDEQTTEVKSSETAPADAAVPDAAVPDAAVPDAVVPDAAVPDAAPRESPARKRACKADARHCCLPNGRIVRPGGCQPIYPAGVHPAVERGPDGYCKPIPCYLRCLPESAAIATPSGPVPIAELAVGDLVFTEAASGQRVAAPILALASVAVEGEHAIVELSLSDGRVVRASAGHPSADGVAVGALHPGDRVDGATVVSARRVAYRGVRTWDLLPDGATGRYWADGVLLGSTLGPPGN